MFSYLAGIASIIGAIFSIWQARKSKSSANRAQEIKNQLISNKKTSEISELNSCFLQAKRSMEKFGPGAIPSGLDGITIEREMHDVQSFFELLKVNRCLFGKTSPNIADVFCEKLRVALETFAESSNNHDLRGNGKTIYVLLIDFSPEIKMILDEKLETTNIG